MRNLLRALVAGTISAMPAGFANATSVAVGYDLYELGGETTVRLVTEYGPPGQGAAVYHVPFVGAPDDIGAGQCDEPRHFDFGDGCVPTGNASMIVKRATPGGPKQCPTCEQNEVGLAVVALSLRTAGETDVFRAFSPSASDQEGTLRILIDQTGSAYPGIGAPDPLPAGDSEDLNKMVLEFDDPPDSGWVSYWSVGARGVLEGETGLVGSADVFMTAAPNLFSGGWGREPPDGAVTIEGVNLNLNGVDSSEDFWTSLQPGGGGALTPARVPLPAAGPLLALGALALAAAARRRRTA